MNRIKDLIIQFCKFGAVGGLCFGIDYGLLMTDGPLKGLLARAVVVVNPEGKVIHTELVPEIAQEPDYHSAINSIV